MTPYCRLASDRRKVITTALAVFRWLIQSASWAMLSTHRTTSLAQRDVSARLTTLQNPVNSRLAVARLQISIFITRQRVPVYQAAFDALVRRYCCLGVRLTDRRRWRRGAYRSGGEHWFVLLVVLLDVLGAVVEVEVLVGIGVFEPALTMLVL